MGKIGINLCSKPVQSVSKSNGIGRQSVKDSQDRSNKSEYENTEVLEARVRELEERVLALEKIFKQKDTAAEYIASSSVSHAMTLLR